MHPTNPKGTAATESEAKITSSPLPQAPMATPPRRQSSSTRSESRPALPPDGGLKAWTQVLMGHLVLINRWGYLTLFGLFQPYYTTSLHISLSAISWIGSVQIFLVYFVRAFSGRALDAGLHHAVLISGSVLQVLGVLMTSFATQYWQVFLAQGVCKGLGDGLVFCPTVFGCDLFLHETGAGYGGHGVGGCDGRDHLSARCATASTPDWLHVDGPDSGLYYPV